MLKRTLIYFLALISLFSLVLLCACEKETAPQGGVIEGPSSEETNGTEPEEPSGTEKITYTIELSCTWSSSLYRGFMAELKRADGSVADTAEFGNGGRAELTLEPDTYSVSIVEKDEFKGQLGNYQYAQKTVTKDSPSVKIELTRPDANEETVEYRVTVLDKDGNPVAGLLIQLCGGPKGMCNPARTDDNGVATLNLPAGEYEVHIDAPPQGNKLDGIPKTSESGGELTVRLSAA